MQGSGFLTASVALGTVIAFVGMQALSDPLPPDLTYRPLPTQPLSEVKANDEAMKPEVMQRQQQLLERRYDLSDRPMKGVMMSGGMKAVQDGVRVKLAKDVNWDGLASLSPADVAAFILTRPRQTKDPEVSLDATAIIVTEIKI